MLLTIQPAKNYSNPGRMYRRRIKLAIRGSLYSFLISSLLICTYRSLLTNEYQRSSDSPLTALYRTDLNRMDSTLAMLRFAIQSQKTSGTIHHQIQQTQRAWCQLEWISRAVAPSSTQKISHLLQLWDATFYTSLSNEDVLSLFAESNHMQYYIEQLKKQVIDTEFQERLVAYMTKKYEQLPVESSSIKESSVLDYERNQIILTSQLRYQKVFLSESGRSICANHFAQER